MAVFARCLRLVPPIVIGTMLLPGGVILMLPLDAWLAWCERGALDRSGTGWTTGGRFLDGFAGIVVLKVPSRRELDLLIGGSTLMAVAAPVLAPRFRPNRGLLDARRLRAAVLLFNAFAAWIVLRA